MTFLMSRIFLSKIISKCANAKQSIMLFGSHCFFCMSVYKICIVKIMDITDSFSHNASVFYMNDTRSYASTFSIFSYFLQ